MRKQYDDDERPSGFWRFVRGVLVALIVCVGAVAVLSVFVLPPPQSPAPEPVAADTGPEVVSGIEVSTAPAYSSPSDSGSTTGAPAPEMDLPDLADLSGPAFMVNAVPFEPAPDTPLVAIVLDDTAANPLLHEFLFTAGLPLTVGIVAGGGGDRETANAARGAGLEVVAQLPLTRQGQSSGAGLEYGLTESEAADRTFTMMQRLPMAVAASRPLTASSPPNASVLRGMVATLTPLGFAYVDHGVAQGDRSTFVAAGLDMPVGVSRHIIPAGAGAGDVAAVLDAAAAEAARRGGAVVFASPGEQLVLALQLWGGEGSGNLARLAPLSAVILRQGGGL